ncbi:hypothetical protein G9A89_019764 [Geosiphon pyriformis]|nr:hypothetical protein G9A89_019764 [Geosiphon pyriformis]
MANAKAKDVTLSEIQEIKENPFVPEYDKPDYITEETLYPIDKLLKPKEKAELIAEDIPFQEPNKATETEQYLAYPDLSKELELKYIDLKIALEIPVNTMVQVAFRSSLAKKKIDVKRGIIDANYTENIIVMLQNNSNSLSYLLVSDENTTINSRINGFESSRRGNIPVNLTKKDMNQKIQDQALLFKANPEICSLADITNLYLPAKAHKHFKIFIHNPTENVIEISEGTLIGSISADIQNSEKLQSIPDFAQLFLFYNITLQYANVFASENKFGCTNIVKHQIDTKDARPIKQQAY